MQLSTRPIGFVAPSSVEPELPFTLKDLKDAIPEYCFKPSVARSLSYFFLDIGIVASLYAIAHAINSWLFFPLFWVAQGTMFWALFVIGHDCGHGSFSKHKWLNNLIGHITHTPILVPYHGWRISHRTHHANTGNIDTDESWYPISKQTYDGMDSSAKLLRFGFFLLAYPFYLFFRSPGRQGSHFLPSSPLFRPSEKWDVITSTTCIALFIGLLVGIGFVFGPLFLINYYIMPYLVFIVWLDLVTYLHHTEPDIPWYRNDSWYFLKGAISTIDRDYGIFNSIHHNIGTHVAHHLFLNMPHYYLKDATAAIKPIMGEYFRESKDSIWTSLWRSARECIYVPNEGQKVYYQKEP
ncbi:MAG: omega-3 fatty acid desaturase (delta-15 desaturase) [Phormidesmis priestleyi Ana]|uniref:Omega-3 fatty acid desaturase (Delta-15 desaturase) n=1 Tax=Phormidesmis priestleyi Ana TaxID=1666911 RepID=A0A0P8A3U9_9CYAN|nr:MAG: omega-3 fatty acid desaturase (delta-15 desaturase) [Phormidesmis priestleyi Ana]